ncbi:hypothetical protein KY290_032089 [Solanum tuberosum]|uniref:Uncharacterized protein n=1 Tax=Solanum tuberosum TaxID=4113 RepID=A0ABQ7UB95_SOLTU|nr:hypothetical protein KY290_032089 [Solanum tuberosum]
MDKKAVWDPKGNTKYCERVDVQLEEREEKETKGLEYGYAFFSAGCLEIERNRRDLKELS